MGVKEKALTAASSIASGDFLRMVTSAGASRKIDYSKLAKAIVEEYNGSTVAGSAQTLKAALDSLNSNADKWTDKNAGVEDLDDISTSCINVANTSTRNKPSEITGFGCCITYRSTSTNFALQIFFANDAEDKIYVRKKKSGTWASWKMLSIIAIQ